MKVVEVVTGVGGRVAVGTAAVAGAAARVGRVARDVVTGRAEWWRAGTRLHVRVGVDPDVSGRDRASLDKAGALVARAVAQRPDVVAAHWDCGLTRLVVRLAEGARTGAVVDEVAVVAADHGLVLDGDTAGEVPHPGEVSSARTAAAGLVLDAVGIVTAVLTRAARFPRTPQWIPAAVTVVREDPRINRLLGARLGRTGAELALATATAAAYGAGQSPITLALDAGLRASQLVEAVTRVAAFEAVHDRLCTPNRLTVGGSVARPVRETPAQRYATTAVSASALAAGATAVVTRAATAPAEVILAGSPRAVRYGEAGFAAGLGTVLARSGVLVRDVERLRLLETVDTLVLHPSALACAGEPDPLAEALLDAARRADLHVITIEDPALGEFANLADEVVPAAEPLDEVMRRARADGHVVLTVARVPARNDDGHPAEADPEVLAALLGSDVAVAVVDEGGAVAWSADLLASGLPGVWRVLAAIPVARAVGRQSRALARAGAVFSGLLLVTDGRARPGLPLPRELRLSPVNTAVAGALLVGWGGALRVATLAPSAIAPRVPWHELSGAEAVSRLAGHPKRANTALSRAIVHRLTAPARWSLRAAGVVRAELSDPLTPVLAVGAGASAIVGSTVDAALVTAAMGINAAVGSVQRLRAEFALAGLAAGQRQRARRVTDPDTAACTTIDATALRVGDVIAVEAGDVVPADARLIEVSGLEIDESALTGESLPVIKQAEATPGAPVGERHCLVFEGTTVVAGHGTAVVVGTGEQTEAGRAVALASRTPPAQGVQARLRELTRTAVPFTVVGGVAVTALSLLRGRPAQEAVSGGVAVAVAAVPEGLPLVATVAQLAAARRLSRHGVLVRNPRALEMLGRVDTVCFDKTGTLTENRLRVVRVTGGDGAPLGVTEPGADPVLRAAARACPKDHNGEADHAHATDEGVLAAGPPDPDWTQLDGRPFEASRGYAAAVGFADEEILFVVKGAPEVVLPCCRDTGSDSARIADQLAGEGLRVLAIAQRRVAGQEAGEVADQPPQDLEFLGFLALADTARAGSSRLIAGLRAAGTRPVMLTGDHPRTAHAIATELGWPSEARVVTGGELAATDRNGRARLLSGADIIARVAPEQKLQVIQALATAGRVVAMVGDGANDAAAIRAADVGIGLAARGSAAARNAADLVLTTGEVTELVDAVTEGRALWHSVADAISILVGGNAGEVGFTVLGTLASGRSPLSTRQLLLVNLLTDMFPAMAVAVTPSDTGTPAGTAETAPVGTAQLGTPLNDQIRQRGIVTGLAATTAWAIGTLTPGTFRRTSTMALCGVVGAQLVQTLTGRRHSPLVLATTLGSAAALAGIIQTPVVSHFFGCTPLGPVACAGVGAAVAVAAAGPRLVPPVERLVTDLAPRIQAALRPSREIAG
ncbi:cation-translocating P-type ATPase [Amycolatopsis taiwanensis]|uniref:cation-translocating P-type ATPase n=1 Tax=Amycolatopsis taiwanensis TaxID=342230 RepID=UPI002554778C|nr:cation-translocating P-type ATPase [Amycolatopsis taiwanensis]